MDPACAIRATGPPVLEATTLSRTPPATMGAEDNVLYLLDCVTAGEWRFGVPNPGLEGATEMSMRVEVAVHDARRPSPRVGSNDLRVSQCDLRVSQGGS